jgi:ketosteroid isomerase-like protein
VEQVTLHLGAAFNGRDPAVLAALYTDDAVLMPPSEPSVHGKTAIRAWFEEALPRLGAIRLSPTGTRTAGALAVQTGTFRIGPPGASSSSAVAHAAASERVGKYILVLTRAGEGWKICWDLWNLDQPAGEGPSRAAG